MTVQDKTANLNAGAVETVLINVRSDSEPNGESFTLTETGVNTGVFTAFIPISSSFNSTGVVFTVPATETSIIASYEDPDCDLDGPNDEIGGVGQILENDFQDVDGDGDTNLGADGIVNSRRTGTFDDDNCFNAPSFTDVSNPGQEDTDKFCVDENGDTNPNSTARCVGGANAGLLQTASDCPAAPAGISVLPARLADCSILRRCQDLLGNTNNQACATSATCPGPLPLLHHPLQPDGLSRRPGWECL